MASTRKKREVAYPLAGALIAALCVAATARAADDPAAGKKVLLLWPQGAPGAKAKVPVEMHLYEQGPHGFGLGRKPLPAASWPERCIDWMKARKLLEEK